MIKWLNKAGKEVETNKHPGNIAAAKAAGWTLAEDSKQMELDTPKKPKSKAVTMASRQRAPG